jgi:hypothetical protein
MALPRSGGWLLRMEESSRRQDGRFSIRVRRVMEGWKDPLNCGWLGVIQRDKHSLNSQEHSAEPNWNIALFCMKQ